MTPYVDKYKRRALFISIPLMIVGVADTWSDEWSDVWSDGWSACFDD